MFYYDPVEEYGTFATLASGYDAYNTLNDEIVVTGPDYLRSGLASSGHYDSFVSMGYFVRQAYFGDGGSYDIDFDALGEFESLIDAAAADAVLRIRSEPDDHRIEYGYFIIRDANGNITLSQRHTSNLPNEINFGGSLSLEETGASRWSDVLGFVHNHPDASSGSIADRTDNVGNRRPSSSDWDLFDQIHARSSDFRLYIVGPDESVRQYDSDDRGRLSHDMVPAPRDGT